MLSNVFFCIIGRRQKYRFFSDVLSFKQSNRLQTVYYVVLSDQTYYDPCNRLHKCAFCSMIMTFISAIVSEI